jgi:hypothetical protein
MRQYTAGRCAVVAPRGRGKGRRTHWRRPGRPGPAGPLGQAPLLALTGQPASGCSHAAAGAALAQALTACLQPRCSGGGTCVPPAPLLQRAEANAPGRLAAPPGARSGLDRRWAAGRGRRRPASEIMAAHKCASRLQTAAGLGGAVHCTSKITASEQLDCPCHRHHSAAAQRPLCTCCQQDDPQQRESFPALQDTGPRTHRHQPQPQPPARPCALDRAQQPKQPRSPRTLAHSSMSLWHGRVSERAGAARLLGLGGAAARRRVVALLRGRAALRLHGPGAAGAASAPGGQELIPLGGAAGSCTRGPRPPPRASTTSCPHPAG